MSSSFNAAKHIKYWRMCSNMLPDHYISTDSSRMTLGFFIVAALDLLGVLHDDSVITAGTRRGWIEWIYGCQLATGGFRGSTGMALCERRGTMTTEKKERGASVWDPANVPATFFALVALLVLGDDLGRVRREETMAWLPRLQRRDGSFGEVLMEYTDGTTEIGGGRDLRYCCCAAGVAYMLQGYNDVDSNAGKTSVIDEDALVKYIASCQGYSGGFGESPEREPHSGLAYCAVTALAFVQMSRGKGAISAGELIRDQQAVIRWMVQRQTDVLVEDDEENDEENDDTETESNEDTIVSETSQERERGAPHRPKLVPLEVSTVVAGFNGREGKIADTCYSWWNVGALNILDSQHLVDADAMKRYLFEKVQHMIGGFGKGIEAPPDVLHSYLGLAAIAIFNQEGVKQIDPTLCVSQEAASRLDKVKWKIRP